MSREYAKRLIDTKYPAPAPQALKNSVVHERDQFTQNMDPKWMCL